MINIGLEGLRFHAFVGLHEEEKTLGNEIMVDLCVQVASDESSEASLDGTVDYESVYEAVKQVMSDKTELLENVVKKILIRIAELSARVESVSVRVTKVHPPASGRIERVFVEEEWTRKK